MTGVERCNEILRLIDEVLVGNEHDPAARATSNSRPLITGVRVLPGAQRVFVIQPCLTPDADRLLPRDNR